MKRSIAIAAKPITNQAAIQTRDRVPSSLRKNIPAKTTRNASAQPPPMRNSARDGLRNAGALNTCSDWKATIAIAATPIVTAR